MAIEFKLPDIGEGVAEGEIVRWIAKEGEAIQEDQPMVEVMTDKATVEITSPVTGRIGAIKAQEGEVVPVHSVIVVLEEGEGGGKSDASESSEPAKAESSASENSKPSAPAKEKKADRKPAPAAAAPARDPGAPVLAAPATRKLAREQGVDLASVPGSGRAGRITRDDLDRFLQGGAAAAPAAAPAAAATPAAPAPTLPVRRDFAEGGEEHVPYRGIRKATGDQMVRSVYTAPHFTYAEEFDLTELYALRKKAAVMGKDFNVKVTFLPFIVKALCAAIRRFPSVNGELREDEGVFAMKQDIHVGIATDTERGLMVPVVRHADKLGALEIAAEMQRLSEEARTGKAKREDLTGSTITITSAGSIGGLFATPIINYPEVAILGVYQIKDKPVVRDGAVVPGKVALMTITLDHRVVDGATAAHFMNHMKMLLEDPGLLVMGG